MLIKPTENYFRIIQTLIKLFSYSTVKCYEKKQYLINIAFLCSPPQKKKNIFRFVRRLWITRIGLQIVLNHSHGFQDLEPVGE